MGNNLIDREIANFNALAEEWWDRNGKCRPLHELNPLRLQFITDRCAVFQKQILDIGCGGGILAESIAARGGIVTGIDAAPDVLKAAKLHAAQNPLLSMLQYVHATAEEYATLYPNAFDVITCMELLEHVPDPSSLIQACAQLLKPAGHLFFSTINRTPKAYTFGILGAEYVLNLLPKGTHDYKQFIRPAELEQAVRKAGLEIKELTGLSYNPFTHKVSFTPDLSVNYLAHVII